VLLVPDVEEEFAQEARHRFTVACIERPEELLLSCEGGFGQAVDKLSPGVCEVDEEWSPVVGIGMAR
jgi:hypothetical protein